MRVGQQNLCSNEKVYSFEERKLGFIKQYAKLGNKLNADIASIEDPSKQNQILMAIELQRKSTENKFLVDCIQRFQEIVNTSRILNDCKALKPIGEKGQFSVERTAACFELWVNRILVNHLNKGKRSSDFLSGIQSPG